MSFLVHVRMYITPICDDNNNNNYCITDEFSPYDTEYNDNAQYDHKGDIEGG